MAAPLRTLLAMVLAALTLLGSGCSAREAGGGRGATDRPSTMAVTAPHGSLQELSPPASVQQLQARLAVHDPTLEILEPQADALLAPGPWTLKLRVEDWPLTDAGPLGLGAHVVVQIDGQQPLRLAGPGPDLAITLPELSPGSHRITAYAALPWGEAVKQPGASGQLRLHRVAPNPQSLPAIGSPQLVQVSSPESTTVEPVLIDWLLLDAPLQHLRDDDARWRLRITVNGDSVLVDQQTPLWIKGFHPGRNALQLELLDGRGDPLNPPFNSLVQEVTVRPGGPGADDQPPAWRLPNLDRGQLAALSGEGPPPADAEQEPPAPPAPAKPDQAEPAPAEAPAPEASADPAPPAPPEAVATPMAPAVVTTTPDDVALDGAMAAAPAPTTDPVATPADSQQAASELPVAPRPEPDSAAVEPGTALPLTPSVAMDPDPDKPAAAPPTEAPSPMSSLANTLRSDGERMAPATSLTGSARDQVKADGTLRRPQRQGPLAGLRERLGR